MAKKQSALASLITAIAYVAIGVIFIIKRAEMLNIIMIVAGAFFILQGLWDILKNKETVTGLVKILLGVAVIVFGVFFISIALTIFGVLLVVYAFITFIQSPKNIFSFLSFFITLAIGVLLIVPGRIEGFDLGNWLFIIVGAVFIVNGVIMLLGKKK